MAPGERSGLLSKTCDRHMWPFFCANLRVYHGGTEFIRDILAELLIEMEKKTGREEAAFHHEKAKTELSVS